MNKLHLAIGAVVLVVIAVLATTELSPAQKEAKAFREMCAKNPQVQECIDWKEMYGH